MNFRRMALFVMVLTSRLFAGASPRHEELRSGVVVEKVAKNSEAERAGIREGDVIQGWSRSEASGEIQSPFDLSITETEQAPRGVVKLEGQRGAEKQNWSLGPDHWGVETRPNFQESLLMLYHDGQELAKAGKFTKAAERWQAALIEFQQPQPSWLSAWLSVDLARILTEAQQWKEADNAYQDALQSATAAPAVLPQILQSWAETFHQRSDLKSAEKYYEQALIESRKSNSESLTVAKSLNHLGRLAWERGDLDKAEEYFRQSLAIREKLAPGSLDVADSLYNLGRVAAPRGEGDKAEERYRQALAIEEKLAPGSLKVAVSLSSLGFLAWARGDLEEAERFYREALVIENKLSPNGVEITKTLNNLGLSAWRRGNLDKAEEYFRQTLTIQQKLAPGSLDVAMSLNNLGLVAWERGDLDKAEEYYHQALTIKEKLAPKSLNVANTLNNLGLVAGARRDLDKAEGYFQQALAIQEKTGNGAASLNNLAAVAQERHNLDQAEQYSRRSLAMQGAQATEDPFLAESLQQLGDILRDRGDLSKAEENYRRALAIREKFAPGSTGHAETLAALAAIMHRQQRFIDAASLFEQALDALESQTTRLGGADETRARFRAQHVNYYLEYIDLLLAQEKPEQAFQVLERSRARGLLETLTMGHVDIRQGVASDLVQRQRSLQDAITAKSNRRIQMLGGKHTEEQAAAANKEIEDLLAKYKEVEEQIRTTSPGYAALTQPQPLSAKEVQQELLDANTVLLEYTLGEERSYVFAVTSNSLAAYELPKRTDIEAAARQVYAALTARNRPEKAESDVEKLIRVKTAEARYPELASALSRMILAPVAALIRGKRLLIVSDGVLEYVPFAALPSPQAMASGVEWTPLAIEHEIVSLPSASVLSVLRQQAARRSRAAKYVAMLADPVFSPNDLRVRGGSTAQAGASASSRGAEDTDSSSGSLFESFLRSASDIKVMGAPQFPRLFFTRREAEAILQTVPVEKTKSALDFDASRATATSPELAKYRIIHFATHGVLNSDHPELSGLVLSLVDARGRRQNGFLWLGDIYNMNLAADLVVLSACETGLGKQIKGEGLVGMTRGFMYAGASRVMASLWKVDDAATAELMKRFYQGMLKDGLEPAAALQRAQAKMWEQKRWKSPYYWAGFVLQGQW